jgi:hypothetical protein
LAYTDCEAALAQHGVRVHGGDGSNAGVEHRASIATVPGTVELAPGSTLGPMADQTLMRDARRMNKPCDATAGGVSTNACACNRGKSVTNHHSVSVNAGSRNHGGVGRAWRKAMSSTTPATRASQRTSPHDCGRSLIAESMSVGVDRSASITNWRTKRNMAPLFAPSAMSTERVCVSAPAVHITATVLPNRHALLRHFGLFGYSLAADIAR